MLQGVSEAPMPITFQTDAEGSVMSCSIPMEPSVAPIVFTREPDVRLADPAFLASLTGIYALGPVRAEVRVAAAAVLVDVAGSGTWRLVPGSGTAFSIDGMPGVTVEFVLQDGRGQEMVVQPGVGVFTRERSATD